MGAFGGGGEDTSVGQKSCSCCSHHCGTSEEPDSDEAPAPDEDCGCSLCLCHGAVNSVDDISINVLLDHAWVTPILYERPDFTASVEAIHPNLADEKPLPTLSGVTARIAYCSIVI